MRRDYVVAWFVSEFGRIGSASLRERVWQPGTSIAFVCDGQRERRVIFVWEAAQVRFRIMGYSELGLHESDTPIRWWSTVDMSQNLGFRVFEIRAF